jgi:hypothetical protein
MLGRSRALTAAWLSPLVLVPAIAGAAQAHRLDAEARVRPDQTVRVDAWFDLTGAPAQGAQVRVFTADDQPLTDGRMDDNGVFVFALPPRAQALRIVVSAGQGHVKELTLKAPHSEADPYTATEPVVSHPVEYPIKDVLIGLGFLTAVAALALSMRNARQLRELSRKNG